MCVNSVKKKEIIDKLLLKVGVSNITWLKRVILYEFLWGRRKNILNLRKNGVVGEIIKSHQNILKHLRCFEKEKNNEGKLYFNTIFSIFFLDLLLCKLNLKSQNGYND